MKGIDRCAESVEQIWDVKVEVGAVSRPVRDSLKVRVNL